jgi:FMN reductase
LSFAVVVGNPKISSRTLGVAEAVSSALESHVSTIKDRLVIDLAEVAAELFNPESAKVNELLAIVAASDLLLVASPTYKASYTGLLKAFFDLYPSNALSNVVAIPLMTGAAPVHALAVDLHLRALLIELGASLPTRGLYVLEQQFSDLDAVIAPWAEGASPFIARALADAPRKALREHRCGREDSQ